MFNLANLESEKSGIALFMHAEGGGDGHSNEGGGDEGGGNEGGGNEGGGNEGGGNEGGGATVDVEGPIDITYEPAPPDENDKD